MKGERVSAIILAAGLSSRSASFKPLLPLGDSTILERVISIFQQNEVDVNVVTGHRSDEVRKALEGRNVKIVDNPDFQIGMFTSVQAGVRNLDPGCKAFFIMPADIPLVRPETVTRLLNEAEKHPGKTIYPVFGKRRGHPPLIPFSLVAEILVWDQDGGLKAVLSGHDSVETPVPDGNILFDVDTPEAYRELLSRLQKYEIPTEAECEAILDLCSVAQDIRQHSQKVAEVAGLIGVSLNKAGCKTDLDAIKAASILHDIAKGLPEHDSAGGQMLRGMGFGYIGEIIAMHTDLGEAEYPLEAKIVYLADKLVNGTTIVAVESRYQTANARFAVTPEIEANIARRKARAIRVKQELESLTGTPLEKLIQPVVK